MFSIFLFLGFRIRIRIRIKIKPWIRIRIEAYADVKHWTQHILLSPFLAAAKMLRNVK